MSKRQNKARWIWNSYTVQLQHKTSMLHTFGCLTAKSLDDATSKAQELWGSDFFILDIKKDN